MKIPSAKFLRILLLLVAGNCAIAFYYLKNNNEETQCDISNKESNTKEGAAQEKKGGSTQNNANASEALLKKPNIPIDVERLNAEHAEDFASILKSVNEPDIPIFSSSIRTPKANHADSKLNSLSSAPESDTLSIAHEEDTLSIAHEEDSLSIIPKENASIKSRKECNHIKPEILNEIIEQAKREQGARLQGKLSSPNSPPLRCPEEAHIIFQIGSGSKLCQQNITQGIEAYMLGFHVESAHHFELAFKADPTSPSAACLLLISHPKSIHAKEARAILKSLRNEKENYPLISPQEERHLEALAYLLVGNRQAAAEKFEKISIEYRADKLAYLWAIVLFHDRYDSLGQASIAQNKALALAAKAQAYWPECPLSAYLSARLEECAPQISATAIKAARLAAEKMPEQGLSALLLAQLLTRSPLEGDTVEQRTNARLELIKHAEEAFLCQQEQAMLPWTSSPNWIRARLQHINLIFLNKESHKASKLYLDTLKKLHIRDIRQQSQENKKQASDQAKTLRAQRQAEAESAQALQQDAESLFYWEVSSLPLRLALGSLQLSSPTQHARLLLKTPQAPEEYLDAQAIKDYKGCLRHALDARYHFAIDNKARANLSLKLAKELLQKLHISSLNSKQYSSQSQHTRALEACQVAIQLAAIFHDKNKSQSATDKASRPKEESPHTPLLSISADQRDILNDIMPPPSLLMPPSIPIHWTK